MNERQVTADRIGDEPALCAQMCFVPVQNAQPTVICHKPDFELEQRCAFADDRETAGGFLNRPCELGACA